MERTRSLQERGRQERVKTSSLASATAVAAVTAAAGRALAEAVEYPSDLRHSDSGVSYDILGKSRFDFLGGINQMDGSGYSNIQRKPFIVDDGADGCVEIHSLGHAQPEPGYSQPDVREEKLIVERRPDGQILHKIASNGQVGSEAICIDGVPAWDLEGSASCPNTGVYEIHPSTQEGRVKVVSGVSSDGWQEVYYPKVVQDDGSVTPDLCAEIERCFQAAEDAGVNRYQSGCINSRESSTSYPAFSAPESRDFLAVKRDDGGSQWADYLFLRDPDMDPMDRLSLTPLRSTACDICEPVIPSGSYEPVPSGVGVRDRAEEELGSVKALGDFETNTLGRPVTILTEGWRDPLNGETFSTARALQRVEPGESEDLPEGGAREVCVRFVEGDPTAGPVDDDGDGIPNETDNCVGRSNPAQTDTNADGRGDACNVDLTGRGNFPDGGTAAGETNASGLRVGNSELGYEHAFADDHGSSWHSNGDVTRALNESGTHTTQVHPGQEVRYIHSEATGLDPEPSDNIRMPDGNTNCVTVYEGVAQVRNALGFIDTLDPADPENCYTPGQSVGLDIGVEGSDLLFRAGTESPACDPDCAPADDDGDGVPNAEDAFPSDPLEWADTDSDTVGDNRDNCPEISNPEQIDTDADGLGDACDPEDPGDDDVTDDDSADDDVITDDDGADDDSADDDSSDDDSAGDDTVEDDDSDPDDDTVVVTDDDDVITDDDGADDDADDDSADDDSSDDDSAGDDTVDDDDVITDDDTTDDDDTHTDDDTTVTTDDDTVTVGDDDTTGEVKSDDDTDPPEGGCNAGCTTVDSMNSRHEAPYLSGDGALLMAGLFVLQGVKTVMRWSRGREQMRNTPDGFTKDDARLEPRAIRERV